MHQRIVSMLLLVSIFSALMVGVLPPIVDYRNNQSIDSGLASPTFDLPDQEDFNQVEGLTRKENLPFQVMPIDQSDSLQQIDVDEFVTDVGVLQVEQRSATSSSGSIDENDLNLQLKKSNYVMDLKEAYELNSPPVPGSNPDVVSLTYYNASTSKQTTWALADSIVDVRIKVKGPFSIGDRIDLVMYERVNGLASVQWASWYYIFDFILGMNQTVCFNLYDVGLNANPLIYGELLGQVNAYYFGLFKNYGLFYDGLNYEGHYLWMWGSLYFDYTRWENSTSIEISLAESGWQVKAKTYFEIVNGPMASVSLDVRNIFDVALWPDELWFSSVVLIDGGGVVHPGRWVIYWTSYISIPINRPYSSEIGNTRGIFVEVWRNAIQLYNGGAKGYELHVLSNIENRAPVVIISYPGDSQLIETSTVNAYCKVIDPNSPYDIDILTMYIQGTPFDLTSYYSPLTQSASFAITIPPGYIGLLNFTIVAIDREGAMGYDTALPIAYPPAAVFPVNYQINEQDVSGTLYSQKFEWKQKLSWSSDENWNITITPFIRFSFALNSSIHLIYGIPSDVDAGDMITALFKVSSVHFPLNIRLEIGFDYYFLANGMFEFANSWLFLDECWDTSIPIDLGVDIIDLRYDIPEIAPIVQALTHYTFSTSYILPAPISWLAELILTLDIIPMLKLQNSLVCSVSGTGLNLETSSLTWLGSDMLAMNCTVDPSLDGTDVVNLDLMNFELHSSLGMNIGTNITLSGFFLTVPMFSININQWMYDYFGILIPTIDVWLLDITIPLPGSATLQANVNPKQMETTITGISATESQIQVTVLLHDVFNNPITGASITGQIGASPYTASELGGGLYRFNLPYTSISFDLDILATKMGHSTASQTMTIFIDPITVDETPPQISGTTNSPTEPQEREIVTVTATIIDALTGVKNASLYYSVDSGAWIQVIMTHSGNIYQANIPTQSAGSSVRYYIETFDNAGHRQASSTYTYSVQSSTTTETPTTPESTTSPIGIPGFPALAIAIGVFLASVIGIITRRRQTRRIH